MKKSWQGQSSIVSEIDCEGSHFEGLGLRGGAITERDQPAAMKR
jgi:hypothetical protein